MATGWKIGPAWGRTANGAFISENCCCYKPQPCCTELPATLYLHGYHCGAFEIQLDEQDLTGTPGEGCRGWEGTGTIPATGATIRYRLMCCQGVGMGSLDDVRWCTDACVAGDFEQICGWDILNYTPFSQQGGTCANPSLSENVAPSFDCDPNCDEDFTWTVDANAPAAAFARSAGAMEAPKNPCPPKTKYRRTASGRIKPVVQLGQKQEKRGGG